MKRFWKTTTFCLLVLCVFIVGMVCGCATRSDGVYIDETIWIYATNRIDQSVQNHSPASDAATGDDPAREAPGGSMGTPTGSGAPSGAGDSSLKLDFRYGGFKGGGAKEVPGCQIGSLNVTADKLTYKWVKGGCEALGAKDKGDYSQTVACAFFWDGSKWVGGKFDWISTSRTSRSFENIKDGYGGWDANSFFGAKRHGFCIVSKDGKWRSNLIED